MHTARSSSLTLAPTLAAFLLIAWSRDVSQIAASFNLGALLIVALLAPPLLTLLLRGSHPDQAAPALRSALQKLIAQLPFAFLLLTAALTAASFNLFAISLRQCAGLHHWLAFHDPFNLFAFYLSILVVHGAVQSQPADEPLRDLTVAPLPPPARIPFGSAPLFLLCALQTSLWLGAWYDPFGLIWKLEQMSHDGGVGPAVTNPALAILANVLGVLVFVTKAALLLALQNALARNLPRYRLAEILPLVKRMLIPAAVFNFIAAAAYLWLTEPMLDLQPILHIALAAVGLLLAAALLIFGAYGRLSARRQADVIR